MEERSSYNAEKDLFAFLTDCAIAAGSQEAFAEALGMTLPLLRAWHRRLESRQPVFALRVGSLQRQRPRIVQPVGTSPVRCEAPPSMSREELQSHVDRVGGTTDFAIELGVSYGAVYAWLGGRASVPGKHLEKIRSLPTYPAMAFDEFVTHVKRLGGVVSASHATGISEPTVRHLLLKAAQIPRKYAACFRNAHPKPRLVVANLRGPKCMNIEEFRELVGRCGGIRNTSRALGIGHTAVHRYFHGHRNIPSIVANTLRALAGAEVTGEIQPTAASTT